VNLDFSHPGFTAYVLLLLGSGIAMIVLASPAFRRTSMVLRVLNTLVGLAYLGYGVYLAFFFSGGTYVMFFQAFVLPVLLVIRTVQANRIAKRQASRSAQS